MPVEDDRLHPGDGRADWFESYWFAFYVPQRKLTVYVYPWFRTALNIWGGGVLAWDDRGTEPWTMLHLDYAWSQPFAGEESLYRGDSIATPHGITIDCLAPAECYRMRYDHPALAFDVTFTATGQPSRTESAVEGSRAAKGHIDQPGHYVGWVRVGDERLTVDCHCVRDRSWGPRRDDAYAMHVGYYHATISTDAAFLFVGHAGDDADRFAMLSGYLIRDGVQQPLASGSARIERRASDFSPERCIVEAEDTAGRTFRAEGRAVTYVAHQPQPGMFNWSSFAEWAFDGQHGYGELQDTWHPDGFRAFARKEMAQ